MNHTQPKKTAPFNIWILSDGLPGHFNQSYGISEALASQQPINLSTANIHLRHKFLRPLMRSIVKKGSNKTIQLFLPLFYKISIPDNKPALIISAGGNSLYANIALSKLKQSINCFSGTLKNYPNDLINVIFTVTPLANSKNNAVLDLPPAKGSIKLKKTSRTVEKKYYALLIGGNGAGYHYKEADWLKLADAINCIAEKDNIHWLITTSRRTGYKAEEILADKINKTTINKVVWYGKNPEKVVLSFLTRAHKVFCTEDSLSMISEAIYSEKPVLTLQPKNFSPDENDSHALDQYQNRGFIFRSPISQLISRHHSDFKFTENYPQIDKQICDALLPLLSQQNSS
ncbi:MAG: mitochondrial fission ELM1 family protein [Gammaproteobacteria bacterium]|nr:mitochondrial fission ELM1 family protein [Gammaproteobacteria bacterium]